MTGVTVKAKRPLTVEDLKELLPIVECQNTTDKDVNTHITLHGDYAELEMLIDDVGNITVL